MKQASRSIQDHLQTVVATNPPTVLIRAHLLIMVDRGMRAVLMERCHCPGSRTVSTTCTNSG